MKYVYIVENVVFEILHQYDPALPGIPIEERYTEEFLNACVKVPENKTVEVGWIYDGEHFVPLPEHSEEENEDETEKGRTI